jgi:hypothetical protein
MTASLATVTWGPSNSQTPISSSPTVPDSISTCSSPSPCCSFLARPRWCLSSHLRSQLRPTRAPLWPRSSMALWAKALLSRFSVAPPHTSSFSLGLVASVHNIPSTRTRCRPRPLHTHCNPVAQPRLRLDFTPLDHAGTSLVTSTLHSSQLSMRAREGDDTRTVQVERVCAAIF